MLKLFLYYKYTNSAFNTHIAQGTLRYIGKLQNKDISTGTRKVFLSKPKNKKVIFNPQALKTRANKQ